MITDKLTHLLHHFADEKFTLCRKTRDSGEQPLQHGDAIALATVDAVWNPGESWSGWVVVEDAFQSQMNW